MVKVGKNQNNDDRSFTHYFISFLDFILKSLMTG